MERRFVITYLLLVALLTAVAGLVLKHFAPAGIPAALYLMPLFFCLTLGLMFLLKRVCQKKNRDRSFFFMEYRMIKMFLAVIFIFMLFLTDRENVLPSAVTFTVFYIVIMMYETIHFIKGEKKS